MVKMVNIAKRWVEVTFRKAGLHSYPAAQFEEGLQAVSYLSHTHRHLFHFTVKIEVFHNDRDIEFLMFLQECESLMEYTGAICGSCEMMAEYIIENISKKYTGRDMIVKVSEDGENSAILEFDYSQVTLN